jgi:hypothetical protein
MKNTKIFNLIVTLILIPLWLGFLIKIFEQMPDALFYFAFGITTLLVLVYLALAIHELRVLWDSSYNFHCRRIDSMINRTRMKLRRIIAKTKNPSVLDYARDRLREICPPETYDAITKDRGKKGRMPDNDVLFKILDRQTRGTNENKQN